MKRFGKPDKRRIVDSTEVWFYYHYSGPNNFRPGSTTAAVVQPDTTKVAYSSTDTLKAKQQIPANTSLSFIFDKQGNVTGYKSQGVDFSYSKRDSFGLTVLKVLGVTAILIVVIGLDVYNNTDINF